MDTYILRILAVLALPGGFVIALNPVVVDTWRDGQVVRAAGLFLSVYLVVLLLAAGAWGLSKVLARSRATRSRAAPAVSGSTQDRLTTQGAGFTNDRP